MPLVLGTTRRTRDSGEIAEARSGSRPVIQSGDTVLLSPACASYDQFNNFEHRGDVFKSLVRSLPHE